MWNRAGFWRIQKHQAAGDFKPSSGLLNVWDGWLGVPSWLLPVLGYVVFVNPSSWKGAKAS